MKKIEAICGYVIMDDNNNIIGYEAADSGNGMIFKDENKGNNVVYIPEIADWDEDYFISADAGVEKCVYTFNDLVDVVLDFFEDYGFTFEQGKQVASYIVSYADWECPETYLAELDIDEIIMLDENGIFTPEQKRLAMENM